MTRAGQRGIAAIVVGAGPAGLAAAAALRPLGRVLVLERSGQAGASWHDRYPSLRLNSTRRRSALPGLPIGAGDRWVSGPDYARYLEGYREHFEIEVRLNTPVARLDPRDQGWLASTADGTFRGAQAVVATGWDHTPAIPDWPGRGGFTGTFLHVAGYHGPGPFAGRRVLLIGSGTSAGEIAVDLVRGGARDVTIAMRTPPTIFPREWRGVPLAALSGILDALPRPAADAAGAVAQRLCNGPRETYRLPPPAEGIATAVARRRRPPMMSDGIVEALRSGRVCAVPEVVGFDGPAVLLAGGSRLTTDAVIAATGYHRGLQLLVGHLGVLDQRGEPLTDGGVAARGHPGLWFVGFGAPLGGQLHLIARQARRLARESQRHPRSTGQATALDPADAWSARPASPSRQ